MPTLAWVGIGCGALLVIGVLVLVLVGVVVGKKVRQFASEMDNDPVRMSAELVVKFNPDLEIVRDDKTAGTLTLRTKSTGEEFTFSYADIAEGRMKFSTGDGEFNLDAAAAGPPKVTVTSADGSQVVTSGSDSRADLPDWVLPTIYPAAAALDPGYTVTTNGRRAGTFTVTADLPAADVTAHYRTLFTDGGFALSESTLTTPDGAIVTLSAKNAAAGREIDVVTTHSGGISKTVVSYAEKPPIR